MYELGATELASRAANLLIAEMKTGKYRNSKRLPPETSLAEELGISRTAVRDALATLEREGFISRKRAVGTLINRHVLNVKVRIDLEAEFLHIVESAGYEPGYAYLCHEFAPADGEVAGYLRVDEGSDTLVVERVVTASGTPLLLCDDYIAAKLIADRSYTEEDLSKPIFDFLERFCRVRGCMDLTGIHAANADARVATALGVREGDAVLMLDEVWYDFDGEPILFAKEYYREGMLTHTILRKRIE